MVVNSLEPVMGNLTAALTDLQLAVNATRDETAAANRALRSVSNETG